MHVPSVDVLMNSVAQVSKNRALGVIMTGMGSDGAVGMTAIFRQGGLWFGQDEASCAVYGMRSARRADVRAVTAGYSRIHHSCDPATPTSLVQASHRLRSSMNRQTLNPPTNYFGRDNTVS